MTKMVPGMVPLRAELRAFGLDVVVRGTKLFVLVQTDLYVCELLCFETFRIKKTLYQLWEKSGSEGIVVIQTINKEKLVEFFYNKVIEQLEKEQANEKVSDN